MRSVRILSKGVASGLLIVLVVAAVTSAAFAAAPHFDAQKLAAINAAMQKFVDAHEVPGIVMVVGSSQGVAYHDVVGSRTLDPSQQMPRDALFRIASMTKPITAIGIMILADEGKLSVDDPVEKHLPEFRGQMLVAAKDENNVTLKKPSRPITLRDLLTHTSGLPGYPRGLGELSRNRNRSLADGALAMSQQPLDFEPGSQWKYCSTGIDVLGRVVEVASGQSFEEFLSARVFQPLGMKDSTFFPSPQQRERMAELCALDDGKLVSAGGAGRVPTERPKNPNPSGGLYSTGADLARLYQMMLGGGQLDGKRILSPAAVKTMTQIQTGDLVCGFSPGMSFGLGFGVVREPQEVTESLSPGTFGHGGGHGTQGWMDPKKDLFVILLVQRTRLQPNADRTDMRRTLQRLAVEAMPSGNDR